MTGCLAEMESLKRMVKERRVVVCTKRVARSIRNMAPKGTEIIVDDRTLNKGGPEMLRHRPAQLAAGIEHPGVGHGRR